MTLSTNKQPSGNWSSLVESSSILLLVVEAELNVAALFKVRENPGMKLDREAVPLERSLKAADAIIQSSNKAKS